MARHGGLVGHRLGGGPPPSEALGLNRPSRRPASACLFFETAPHDAQGWWELNVAYLPVVGDLASAAAFMGGTVDGLFQSPVVFGFVVGGLAVGALLMGGGESMSVISLASVAMATMGAALALVVRDLGSPA